ncbi:MAG TPA: hypothetical protein VGM90_29010 [Kofleriaceae bacterium]|jgi:hypothetical protein
MTATAGTLTAAADKLCAQRGYQDDIGSVERALRRLRRRGTADGGTWGTRAVALFGLPDAVDARVRMLGQYHSRIADLPRSMCEDLLRAWDKPPLTEAKAGRAWIAVARATLSLRSADLSGAIAHLDRARTDLRDGPPAARFEALLARSYVASRLDPSAAAEYLAEAETLIDLVADLSERACLRARWADHAGFELNRAGKHVEAEALYTAMPDDATTPPFARARRASGIAYARHAQKHADAAQFALAAIDHAGDGGHLRARAMALQLHARITGDAQSHERALAIANHLEDATLLGRFTR